MNPIVFAMRHPITTMMLVVALISGGGLAYNRMRVDIFPSLNVPKIYVFLDYIGMSPDQVEGFIVNQLELYFQYVDGIEDINTRNIQQVALCELSFFPGTDMGQAMAQVVAMSDRAMSWMPKGTLPPMIMRMDSGSVPVGYLVFESEKTSLGAMGDLAQNVIRPLVQKYVPGTVAISPFGPNMRSIVVNVDPQKLLAYNLKPQQVIDALASGNTIIPAGNLYVKDSMPVVSNNATVVDIQRLGDIPLKVGRNVYLRDVASILDDTDITYGYALVNGKKSVYLPIIKKDTGSTLTVVSDVRKSMELFRNAIRPDMYPEVKLSFEFDESPTVVAAVESVFDTGHAGPAHAAGGPTGELSESLAAVTEPGAEAEPGEAADSRFDKVLAFPWDPTAVSSDPFVTHHTQEELLDTLGFDAKDVPEAERRRGPGRANGAQQDEHKPHEDAPR